MLWFIIGAPEETEFVSDSKTKLDTSLIHQSRAEVQALRDDVRTLRAAEVHKAGVDKRAGLEAFFTRE